MSDTARVPSLEQFPRIPRTGQITVAESHSELHSLASTPDNPITGRGFFPETAKYNVVSKDEITARLPFKIPAIKVSNEKVPIILLSESQGITKTIWNAWREDGFSAIHNCLSSYNTSELGGVPRTLVNILTTATRIYLSMSELPSRLFTRWYPHLQWKTRDINEQFSNIRGWKESWIRALTWHPNAPLMAIALDDDTVRLCFIGHEDVPMLRCQEQINISCISWRPVITTEIAVGCENCIVIWYLASSVSKRQTKDKTEILIVEDHCPISSVEYSSDGLFLLSSSAKDSTVYIWQTFMWDKAPLRRVSGGGIPLAIYSPKGFRFMTASSTNVFWIWNQANVWECKRWTTPKTMIEAACWNQEGTVLLFATGGFIYALYFELSAVDQFIAQTDSIVKPLYNIEECHVLDEDDNLAYKVGGSVRHMDWDKSGQRVAVIFDDSEMVAVFRFAGNSRTEPLVPLGFIRGHANEYPLTISFQKSFKDGALLTIAWSSQRLQYFPMVFALPSVGRNLLHDENYRDQFVIQRRPSMFSAAGFVSPRLSVSRADPPSSSISALFSDQNDAVSPNRLYSVPLAN